VSELTIGIDIGGTKMIGGVVDVDGTIVARARRDTPAGDTAKTLDFLVELVEELAGGRDVVAVGVGAAGWFDRTRSQVLFAPNLAWRDEPLRDRITERVNLPVVVENDGNVAAWAEFRYGAARDALDSMALFTVGTGIGGPPARAHPAPRHRGRDGARQGIPGGQPGCGRRAAWSSTRAAARWSGLPGSATRTGTRPCACWSSRDKSPTRSTASPGHARPGEARPGLPGGLSRPAVGSVRAG
jgi:predicted NBD/HSP70 family sugar kinase